MKEIKIKPLTYLKPETDIMTLDEFMPSFIEQFAKKIAKKYDDYMFGLFEKAGYSREEVIELGEEKRLTELDVGNRTEYYLDGEFLFAVERVFTGMEKMDNGLYHTKTAWKHEFADGTMTVMED